MLLWRPWHFATVSESTTPSPTIPATLTASSTSPPPAARPAPPPPTESPPTTSTTHEVSRAGFYGEWGQHATSVTLAPDGSAHYVVSSGIDPTSGEFNSIEWAATWSPMTSTTAMIVLSKQLDATGDTSGFRWTRYPGEALTFTLISGGYATITEPSSSEPITLCPRNTGFQDRQMLCGA